MALKKLDWKETTLIKSAVLVGKIGQGASADYKSFDHYVSVLPSNVADVTLAIETGLMLGKVGSRIRVVSTEYFGEGIVGFVAEKAVAFDIPTIISENFGRINKALLPKNFEVASLPQPRT